MKYLRRLQLKILLWWLNLDKIEGIEEEEKLWLSDSYKDAGFISYCKTRHIEILKNIAINTQKRDWQRVLELNGHRLEILLLQARAQTQYRKGIL